jgi:Ca2+-binding EF-hand superfamily protein
METEFQNILNSHGIITFDRDIKGLFSRFDKDKDGFINYKDFKSEISPIKTRKYKASLN